MAINLFCTVTAGRKGFIRNVAEERRYKDALFRMAGKEMADIVEYACLEGKMYFVINCSDMEAVRRIVKAANASYGKYKKLIREEIDFDPLRTELLKEVHQYNMVKQQFFNTFYIAEKSSTVV